MKLSTLCLFLAINSLMVAETITITPIDSGVSVGESYQSLTNQNNPFSGYTNIANGFINIVPNSVWTIDPAANWISFTDSGMGGSLVPNDTNSLDPNAWFYQAINVAADANIATLNMTVWGDDTVKTVLIDNTTHTSDTLTNPNFGQATHCSPVVPTCTGVGDTLIESLAAGNSYTLAFGVWQTGGDTFGLQYGGNLTETCIECSGGPTPTPEPASMVLLGTGLLGIGLFRSRFQK